LEGKAAKQPTASSTDNDLEKENTSPKLSNNPLGNKIQDLGTSTTVRHEIKVGDKVVAIRQCLFFSTYHPAKH